MSSISRIALETGLLAQNLAAVYYSEKRYADAEALFACALAVREMNFGPDDPALATLFTEYSRTLRAEGKFSEAEQAEVRSTRIAVVKALTR